MKFLQRSLDLNSGEDVSFDDEYNCSDAPARITFRDQLRFWRSSRVENKRICFGNSNIENGRVVRLIIMR